MKSTWTIAHDRVAHETVEGEVVILDRLSGSYFSLTGAGADAWALFGSPRTTEAVAEALANRYHAAADEIAAAVAALVEELARESLLVVGGEPVAIAMASGERTAFVAPRLEKYTDLQDILLLDPIHEVDEVGWPKPAKQATGA